MSKQCNKHVVSRSSTEAEHQSLAPLVAKITWITPLVDELKMSLPKPPIVWWDNRSTALLSPNPFQHARREHVKLDLYFVKEKVIQGKLFVKHSPSIGQVADILTKAKSSSWFNDLHSKVSVRLLSILV